MRALFLILVVANLAFFSYARWLRVPAASPDLIPRLQVSPEKIKLIGVGPRSRTGSAPRPRVAGVCLEWGLLAGAEAARADAAVARLELPQVLMQRAVANAGGYWVYLPPLKTQPEIDKRVAALKSRGVQDFYIVQEPGQWHNAISLGIFKSEETARNMAAKLRSEGVRDVAFERRENLLKQIAYFVREPGEDTVAKLTALQRDFPGTEVKAVPCPQENDPGATPS